MIFFENKIKSSRYIGSGSSIRDGEGLCILSLHMRRGVRARRRPAGARTARLRAKRDIELRRRCGFRISLLFGDQVPPQNARFFLVREIIEV
jgi:hypothetical protein